VVTLICAFLNFFLVLLDMHLIAILHICVHGTVHILDLYKLFMNSESPFTSGKELLIYAQTLCTLCTLKTLMIEPNLIYDCPGLTKNILCCSCFGEMCWFKILSTLYISKMSGCYLYRPLICSTELAMSTFFVEITKLFSQKQSSSLNLLSSA